MAVREGVEQRARHEGPDVARVDVRVAVAVTMTVVDTAGRKKGQARHEGEEQDSSGTTPSMSWSSPRLDPSTKPGRIAAYPPLNNAWISGSSMLLRRASSG